MIKIETATIFSLVAAIAAIVAPVITAVITARYNLRTKALDLYFSERSSVFRAFMSEAVRFSLSKSHSVAEITELQKLSAQALLFASPDTQEKISIYQRDVIGLCDSPTRLDRLGDSYKDAIRARQRDLSCSK